MVISIRGNPSTAFSLFFLILICCAGRHPDTHARPNWIDHLPHESGRIYALGYSLPYLNPADAWNSATQKGRLELAKTFQVRVETTEWWHDWEYGLRLKEEVGREALDLVELTVSKVVERHYDEGDGLYYVLVAVETGLAASQLRERWRKATEKIVKQLGTKEEGHSIRDRAERAFEDLKEKLHKGNKSHEDDS